MIIKGANPSAYLEPGKVVVLTRHKITFKAKDPVDPNKRLSKRILPFHLGINDEVEKVDMEEV